MTPEALLKELRALADPKRVEGMARYGINPRTALGVSIPSLRKLARKVGTDHRLAAGLWATGVHEARVLAGMIDDPAEVTPRQMDRWAGDFNSWDVCDQCCLNLFRSTPHAWKKVAEWARREEEFVRRAAFALLACLAVGDKEASDKDFARFLPVIKSASTDERNYVRKAVNWALRQIGKRNSALNTLATRAAHEIAAIDSKAARWIATNALRELTSKAVRQRLARKANAARNRR